MASSINLNIDLSSVGDDVKSTFALQEAKVTIAVKRAIRKVSRWLAVQSKKSTAQTLRITQKSIKTRFNLDVKGDKAYLWIGLQPLDVERFGKPRQTKQGVSVKEHFLRGAFVSNVYGKTHVWRRLSSKHQPNHKGKGRFPLVKQTIEIAPQVLEAVNKIESQLNERYQTILQQELNYEFNVK